MLAGSGNGCHCNERTHIVVNGVNGHNTDMIQLKLKLSNRLLQLDDIFHNRTGTLFWVMKITFYVRNPHTKEDKKEGGNGDDHRQLPSFPNYLHQFVHAHIYRLNHCNQK